MMTRISLVLLVATGIASADPKADAKVHIDKAAAFHAQNKFIEALNELDAAYQIDPDPGLLYAIAQVQVKLDRCAEAIFNYERFIATKPGDKATKAATEAIDSCRSTLRAKALAPDVPDPKPQPEPTPKPPDPEPKPEPAKPVRVAETPPPPPVTPPPEKPSGPRAWYADPLGGVLVGAGVAGGIVSVVLYRQATSDIDATPDAANYGKGEELVDRAASRRRLAAIAGIAGGALVVGGVVRYVIVRGKEQRTVAITPTTGGAAVTFGGRW